MCTAAKQAAAAGSPSGDSRAIPDRLFKALLIILHGKINPAGALAREKPYLQKLCLFARAPRRAIYYFIKDDEHSLEESAGNIPGIPRPALGGRGLLYSPSQLRTYPFRTPSSPTEPDSKILSTPNLRDDG